LLKTADDIGIDATLSALPFEAEIIDRSSLFEFAPGRFPADLQRRRLPGNEDLRRAPDRLARCRDGVAALWTGGARS
jgi:hypothetical protein